MGVAGCKPAVGAKRVENDVEAIQKWVPFTPKFSQNSWRLGLHPRPSIARESGRAPSALASLTRKIENSVNAIQKWVPFTPNCSQVPKALVAGAPPQTLPPIARESAFALASLTCRREGRQFPSSPRAPETLGTPLEGRSHCTAHNDLVSVVAHILASIIQGSVIGPASYVVNASDLRTVKSENDLVKCADDTDLIVAEEHVETRFEELDNISTWADANNLKLNKAKSVEIVFRRPRGKKAVSPPPIPGIARVEEFSFLGVTFGNNFSVDTHVNELIASCARTLYALRILRAHGMNTEAIHSVFKSTVLARLLYASPAWWGFTNASQRNILEAFIRKSIRLGFCPDSVVSFQSMCEGSDEQFFKSIKNNLSHVLRHLPRNKSNSGYDLGPREHNYVLPENSTRLAYKSNVI